MVSRVHLSGPKPKIKTKNGHGGPRKNAGRRTAKKKMTQGYNRPVADGASMDVAVMARKRAHTTGIPPHELLCQWAQKGYILRGNVKQQLTPDQMISCASKAAAHYHPPMKAIAMRMEETQSVRMEVDMAKLAELPTSKLEMLREVVLMFSKMGLDGGMNIGELLEQDKGDAGRFADQLN